MTALGLALIGVALVLLLAEAHLSTGGLIGAGASAAAIGGAALLLLSAGAGAALALIVTLLVVVLAVGMLLGLIAAAASVRILREYERAVVFRLGRLLEQKGPGVVLLIPFLDRMVRVSLRTVTQQIPPQEVITRDNVPARVTAVTYFHVVDPNKSVVKVQDVLSATSQIAQTTLRSVL